MEARDAARVFHDWAYKEGLMPDGPFAPVASSAPELALVQPVTDLGKQLLRAKNVQSLAFSSARSEIVVFTKKVAPQSKRLLEAVPFQIDDIAVKYRQGVQHPIGPEVTQPFGGPAYVIRAVGQSSCYTCGSSISVGNNREAGTLGCLVKDQAGSIYGLSNNHVTGGCSFAGVNLPIVAPGIFDVVPNGLAPFTIGFHSSSLPFVAGSADNVQAQANLDASIFRLVDPSSASSHQGTAYDTPITAGAMLDNIDVEKVGRTTQHTRGRVIGQMYGAHPVNYNSPLYGFSGTVYFDPVFAIVGQGQLFSDTGDSGALVTTLDQQGQRIAVGIVIGGKNDGSAPGGKTTIVLPILPILQAFGVSFVGGHNV